MRRYSAAHPAGQANSSSLGPHSTVIGFVRDALPFEISAAGTPSIQQAPSSRRSRDSTLGAAVLFLDSTEGVVESLDDASDRRDPGVARVVTPLEKAPESLAAGRELYLKREDTHELGSFKWRGALPTLAAYRDAGATGVVTASTGNHGAATAWAAARTGLSATVFAPEGASATKLDVIRRNGASIRVIGRDLDAAKEAARRFAAASSLPFFEDGAEPTQYEGYASIAEEVLDQLGRRPAAMIVPVGNGALIAGIGRGLARRGSSETRLIGVVAREAPVMALSFDAGRPVACERMDTFADGLAVRVAIPDAVDEMKKTVSRVVLVSEREIARAIAALAGAGIRVEGAAAAALAGLGQIEPLDGPSILILTGRNIDESVYQRALSDPESFPG